MIIQLLVKINEFSCKLYQRDNKSQMQPDLGDVLKICFTSLPFFVIFMIIIPNWNLSQVKKICQSNSKKCELHMR